MFLSVVTFIIKVQRFNFSWS